MAEVADWNLRWEQSRVRWEDSCRKMNEAFEQLRASFGQMADDMKKLREESEASEQVTDSCAYSVEMLQEDIEQPIEQPTDRVISEVVLQKTETLQEGTGKRNNKARTVHSSFELANSQQIKHLDRQESGIRGTPTKDYRRKFSRMSSSWKSEFKGGTDFFSELEFPILDGLKCRSIAFRGFFKSIEATSSFIFDPGSSFIFDPGGINCTMCDQKWELHELMFSVKFSLMGIQKICEFLWLTTQFDGQNPMKNQRQVIAISLPFNKGRSDFKLGSVATTHMNRRIDVKLQEFLLQKLNVSGCQLAHGFDPGIAHKLDLQHVLIASCWVLGRLIFIFDPGGMIFPWLKVLLATMESAIVCAEAVLLKRVPPQLSAELLPRAYIRVTELYGLQNYVGKQCEWYGLIFLYCSFGFNSKFQVIIK